ncbi:MAG: hypothetical protein OHK0046_47320 [Anaerolineae bacterium]
MAEETQQEVTLMIQVNMANGQTFAVPMTEEQYGKFTETLMLEGHSTAFVLVDAVGMSFPIRPATVNVVLSLGRARQLDNIEWDGSEA